MDDPPYGDESMTFLPSRLSLPFDLGDLLLTPQWPGLAPGLRFGLIALVCIVPLVLVTWLYRWELRVVSRVAALSLLGLRLVVLLLLLFLVCLQPVHARDKTFGLPGRILVVVDRSDSMDVADPQRTPAEKLRLALALKIAGDLATDDQLAEWAGEYERNKAPQSLSEEEKKLDRLKRRDLETRRKEARDEIFARVDVLTRGAVARRVLGPEGIGLLATLEAKHAVELLGFHQEVWDLRPDQLDELFRTRAAAEGGPAAASASAYTDIRKPLLRALEMAGPGQGKVLGVVLLTDGQHNSDESPVKKAAEMGDRGLPIYPVALGARKPPPDAALISVKAPPAVFRDVDLNVEVRFKVSGMAAQEFNVVLLLSDDKTELERHIYKHNGKDQERTETFKIRLDKTGSQTLVAVVEPADPRAKETRTDNNSRAVVVNVADEKAKVLLVDGEARWEYHYLATALKRDRRMQLQTVVFTQPRLQERDAEEAHALGLPRQQLPAGQDALAEFDCIILGDVSPEQLPLADRVRLEKYVADRGGTLVVLAGKRSMPLAFPDGATGGETDPLRKLLPIEAPHAVSLPEGFSVALSEEGRETTFMRLGADSGGADEVWSRLPKHYWAVVGRAKPGAMSLASIADRLPDGTPGAGPEREREQGLIVRHNYGFGRVLFVGLDSTWRWRYRTGDQYHHTFWGDAIHWAAADKALGGGNEYVRFGTSRPVYHKGERPEVVVRLGEELGPIKADMLAGARVLRRTGAGDKEEAVALVPLTRRTARPRVLEGQAPALPPGQYALELVIPDLENKLKSLPAIPGSPPGAQPAGPLRTTFSVQMPESTELIDLQTNWTLLEELASKSGGTVFTPEDAADLANLLARQTVPYVEHHEQRLWQWWVVLVVVVSLMTLEWVGRKVAGLP
jgi:hypothetical protein